MRGKRVWQGHPSLAIHRKMLWICGLFFWLIVPVLYAWIICRRTKNIRYELTDYAVSAIYPHYQSANRLLELYRIEEMEIEQPEPLARRGLANLLIKSTNPNIPPIVFEAIPDATEVKRSIEALIEEAKQRQNIQDIKIPILQG